MDLLVFGLKADNRKLCHANIVKYNEAQKEMKTSHENLMIKASDCFLVAVLLYYGMSDQKRLPFSAVH